MRETRLIGRPVGLELVLQKLFEIMMTENYLILNGSMIANCSLNLSLRFSILTTV